MPATTAVVGKKNEALLEAGEADSPYAAILENVAEINFRALVDQWNKNGLMETDIDAVSNRVPTGLGMTPTPTSSMSFSLPDSSRTEAGTSDIQTAAVYTRLRSTPTSTSSVSISVDEASTTDAETSEIHTAAGLRTTPNPTPTMSISLSEASNTKAGASVLHTSAASECNHGDATKAPPPSLKSSSPIDNYCSPLNENAGLENNAVLEVDSTSTSSVHLHLCGSSATEAADLDVHEFADSTPEYPVVGLNFNLLFVIYFGDFKL